MDNFDRSFVSHSFSLEIEREKVFIGTDVVLLVGYYLLFAAKTIEMETTN